MKHILLAGALALLAGLSSGTAQAQGRLVIVGGGLTDTNADVYNAFLEGIIADPQARIAVIAAASGSPASSAAHMRDVFASHGFDAARVDIVQLAVRDDRDTQEDESGWDRGAYEPDQIALVEGASAVWFTGGDQMRLTQVLRREDGSDTPMLAMIRQRHEDGATLGGTSAGAAIMSAVMIQRGDTLTSLLEPVLPENASEAELESGRLSLGPGLGFFPLGLVDQHFEERARLGRLARALVASGTAQGFGIDEDTGLIVDFEATTLFVAGAGGVSWIDASRARPYGQDARFGVSGLLVSYLTDGDRLNWSAGDLDIAGYKSATIGNEYFGTPAASGGGMALPPGGLPETAGEALLDNSASSEVERVSFRADGAGIAYRFTQTPQSAAYWGRNGEGEAYYSIIRAGFEILPVSISISYETQD